MVVGSREKRRSQTHKVPLNSIVVHLFFFFLNQFIFRVDRPEVQTGRDTEWATTVMRRIVCKGPPYSKETGEQFNIKADHRFGGRRVNIRR